MLLDFTKCNMAQLLQIAYDEKCPTSYKYKALFELKKRREKQTNQEVSRFKRLAAYSGKSYQFYSK